LADPSYNPTFTYPAEVDQDRLKQYGLPRQPFLSLAQEIVDRAFSSRNYQDLVMSEGKQVTRRQVEAKTITFLEMHGLAQRFKMSMSESYVARTSISADTIKLRLPIEFRKESLLGMLYHEVGTHALRRVNYERQPWYRSKNKYGFRPYLKTEEGLAVMHSLLAYSLKLAYKPALLYLTCQLAQRASFAQVYSFLMGYYANPEHSWRTAVRHKRGLVDTSQPGGYTKDLIYFEGLVEVWHWLKNHHFKLDDLYLGKLAYQDAARARRLNPEFEPLLPSFYQADHDLYSHRIAQLGQENRLDQIATISE